MKPIKAVIFDMDGVLIDSEPVYLHHQYTQLKPSYPWITVESMYPLVGISGQEYMPFMAKLCRRTDDAVFRQEMDAMNADCRVYYPDILRKEVRPLLHELKQMGLQVALASSSSRECIEQVLAQCEIRELFDCIVSGHEFTRSKPDPEIYRFTMDKLRRKPEECLIVEDSTYGVQAGTAAGGKTGLTAITVGVLFLLILFLSPLSYLVPGYATAPALMYVGLLMLSNVAKIDFADFVDAMAGLVTAVFIVLTCNIVTGIMIGFATLVIGRLVSGEWRKLNIGTVVIAVRW